MSETPTPHTQDEFLKSQPKEQKASHASSASQQQA